MKYLYYINDEEVLGLIKIIALQYEDKSLNNVIFCYISTLLSNPVNLVKWVDACIFFILNPELFTPKFNEHNIISPILNYIEGDEKKNVHKNIRENFLIICRKLTRYWIHCTPDLLKKYSIKSLDELKNQLKYKKTMSEYTNVLDIVTHIFTLDCNKDNYDSICDTLSDLLSRTPTVELNPIEKKYAINGYTKNFFNNIKKLGEVEDAKS